MIIKGLLVGAAALVAVGTHTVFKNFNVNNLELVGEVTEKTARQLVKELNDAGKIRLPFEVVDIDISSPGGSIYAMHRIIGNIKELGFKVTTRTYSYAASAAGDIFLMGDRRIIGKEAMVLIHEGRIQHQDGLILTTTDVHEIVTKGDFPPNTSEHNKKVLEKLKNGEVKQSPLMALMGITADGTKYKDKTPKEIAEMLKPDLVELDKDMQRLHKAHIKFLMERLNMTEADIIKKVLIPNVDKEFTAEEALKLGIATEIA